MEAELDSVRLAYLKEKLHALVESCQDWTLLDLVYKMLLHL